MSKLKCSLCNTVQEDPVEVAGCVANSAGYHDWENMEEDRLNHCAMHSQFTHACPACCKLNGWDTRYGVPEVQQIAAFAEHHCTDIVGINQYMSISQMQARIHQQNKEMGWWDNPREMGTLLCLVHSEISEAMEGERKGLMDDHLPHRSMLEVELADAMIRIMDIAASRGLDLAGAIVEKVDYNRKRADHQPGARAEAHGKKF
nr:MAG: MazG-like family protein [Bacteriophage sp.]